MSDQTPDVTHLLSRWRQGDKAARDALLVAVYPAMREMASRQLGPDADRFTLRPTELAHEAYVRLQAQRLGWENREHFQAIVATVLRRVVVDYLRRRNNLNRGSGIPFIPLDELDEASTPVLDEASTPVLDESVDWLRVDEALNGLERENPDLAKVVELKFFSGLKTEEIARVMDSSVATVGRQWRFAKAWLGEQLAL